MRRSSAARRSCMCAPMRTGRSRRSGSPTRSTSARRWSAARRSRIARDTGTTSPRSPRQRTRAARSCLADSYQAAGAIELDVQTLGADFVTGGTVKYLLASAGLGFLWVRGNLLARLVPTQTGLVRRRGHLPHGHLRLLAARNARAVSTQARPRCPTSTRASQACLSSRRPGCPRSRRTCGARTPG